MRILVIVLICKWEEVWWTHLGSPIHIWFHQTFHYIYFKCSVSFECIFKSTKAFIEACSHNWWYYVCVNSDYEILNMSGPRSIASWILDSFGCDKSSCHLALWVRLLILWWYIWFDVKWLKGLIYCWKIINMRYKRAQDRICHSGWFVNRLNFELNSISMMTDNS